jgi:hypothetical protein
VAGFYESCNEHLVFVKCGELLDWPRKYMLLKKGCLYAMALVRLISLILCPL